MIYLGTAATKLLKGKRNMDNVKCQPTRGCVCTQCRRRRWELGLADTLLRELHPAFNPNRHGGGRATLNYEVDVEHGVCPAARNYRRRNARQAARAAEANAAGSGRTGKAAGRAAPHERNQPRHCQGRPRQYQAAGRAHIGVGRSAPKGERQA